MDRSTVLQQITLANDFLQQISEDCLNDKTLSQIENEIKTIADLSQQSVNKMQISQFLSDIGIAFTLYKVMKILRATYNVKNWSCLFTLRSTCITLSAHFESFCKDLCSAGFITTLIKELRQYEKIHLAQNAEEYMVVSALCILENAAQISGSTEIFWEMKTQDALLPYTRSPLLHVCVPALVLLGLLCLDVDCGIISLDKELIVLLSTQITSALHDISLCVDVGYVKMSASELLRAANGLALNKTNAMHFLESDILLSLIKFLKTSDIDSKLSAVEFIWTLATHFTVKEQLCTNPEIPKILNSLVDFIPTAKCALLKIQGWNEKEDADNTINYLKCAYQEQRYNECVNICESIPIKKGSNSSNYSQEVLNIIKLLFGKSLYFAHVNNMKYSKTETNTPSFHRKEHFVALEKAIQMLGAVKDGGMIDEEGTRFLDLAMIDYIRETNSLKDCRRCLLCHSKSDLRSSHVIPNFVLSGFAKGLKMTSSKKVYISFSGSDEHKFITPRQAAWWMLCGNCELLLSSSGESPFAKEFFHEIYKASDPSNPTKEHGISYSKWLYHFAAGILFRGLAVNPKGISGFLNDADIYRVFTTLKKIIRSPDDALEQHLKIAIFANPLSLSPDEEHSAFTLHRLLNMPGFVYLMENDEKVNYHKIPTVANFLLAHLGILNIVVTFPGGDFVLPEEACIDVQYGLFVIPAENQRLQLLPTAIRQSLTLIAQILEIQEIKITQKRLQDCRMYDSTASPPEALGKVYGLEQAKQNDIKLLQQVGFQPSSDPRFPKAFNLLPSNILVKRGLDGNNLCLPPGHKLLLHQTLESGNDGITYFLCVGVDEEGYSKTRPYIVKHRYMPGLYIDTGFFISAEDLSPEEVLPDKHPKFYAESLFSDLKSSSAFQEHFSDFLKKLDITVTGLLELHSNNIWMNVKCVPLCWFCIDRCDVCYSCARNSLILYKQTFLYCSDICRAKLVKPPPTHNALPEGYEIKNEYDGSRHVVVPNGHVVMTHTTTEFVFGKDNNQSGNLTMFLCRGQKESSYRPYILCHMHSLVEQFSIGMYISPSNFVPMELLPDCKSSDSHTHYIDSLYSSGIITMLLLNLLRKHQLHDIDSILQCELSNFHDKRCDIPCWYCKDKCVNCFALSNEEEYCSDVCRDMHETNVSPHVFSSLPKGFIIKRSFKTSESSIFTLPQGHHHLLHTTGSINTKDGKLVSELTMILCVDETTSVRKPYILFHEYKPQRNRLANVGLLISTDDFSIKGPMCQDDIAGQIFVNQLKSPQYNISLGIKEALKRRGFTNMDSFLECASTKRMDIKCSSLCWFCERRCLVCLQPADIVTNINGENIHHCCDECLQVVYKNPGIIHLLPVGYEVVNNPSGEGNGVILPTGHQRLLHISRKYRRNDGRYGHYTLIVCANIAIGGDIYVLYHQFNFLRQVTFGFYISSDNLEIKKPLQCSSKEDQMKCLRYMNQLIALEPFGEIIKTALAEQGVLNFELDTLKSIKDTVCVPPCWYCKSMK